MRTSTDSDKIWTARRAPSGKRERDRRELALRDLLRLSQVALRLLGHLLPKPSISLQRIQGARSRSQRLGPILLRTVSSDSFLTKFVLLLTRRATREVIPTTDVHCDTRYRVFAPAAAEISKPAEDVV